MKCINQECQVISLVPRTICPECGSSMIRIQFSKTIESESVNIEHNALVVQSEIKSEEYE